MAKYDNQPSKFEAVGNGSFLYRYNIQEVQPEVAASEEQQAGEGQAQEQQTERPYWECEEVLIWAPVTSDKITKAVIEHCCSSDRERFPVNNTGGRMPPGVCDMRKNFPDLTHSLYFVDIIMLYRK